MQLTSYWNNKVSKSILILIVLLLLSLFRGLAQSEDINFRHYTRDQGLSSNSISAICQDADGYMWFGSENGLDRYNGYNFKSYKSTSGLLSPQITHLMKDSKSRMWAATGYGVSVYDEKLDRFKTFATPGVIKENSILFLHEDKKGAIWLGSKHGLRLFNLSTKKFQDYYHSRKENALTNYINCIYNYTSDLLWLGSAGGLTQFNKTTRRFVPLSGLLGNNEVLQNSQVKSIVKDRRGNIWIATYGRGVYIFNPIEKTLKNFGYQNDGNGLSSNLVLNILCDHKGDIWVATENGGINFWDVEKQGFKHYENDLRKPSSFSQKTASYLFEDNQKNMWAAAPRGGVDQYSPGSSKFKTYTSGLWPGALSYRDVKTFLEDREGNIWVGTDGGGLNFWDRANGRFRAYRHNPKDPTSIGSDAVCHIMQDRKGRIWVGTWNGGLNLFNGESGTFTRFVHDPKNKKSIGSNNAWYVHEDKDGLLWVATYFAGLKVFNPDTKEFKSVTSAPDGKTQFTGTIVLTIHEDKSGNLWFGTEDGGLNCLSADRQKFTHFFNDVQMMLTDRKNRLWACRTGLYLFNKGKKTFSLVSSNPYLVNERLLTIAEDNQGNLWLGTRNGLLQYNPDTKYFKRYTDADGLQGLDFNTTAVLKTRSGQLLFGGSKGFNMFDPGKIKATPFRYPICFTDFQVFNKSVIPGPGSSLEAHVSKVKRIRLDYNQSAFSFEFAALNFVNPAKTKYSYKLKGFDKHWNDVGGERKASYTNLDPGDYTFYVKASNTEDGWNSAPAFVHLSIEPPFWMTWWFRILIVLLISGPIYIFLYYRRKSELELFHNQKREELHQLQLQFFVNISHEFRTPLTLILGTLEQMFKQEAGSIFARQFNTIHRNANRLMQLISELMDFRKTEAGALKLKIMQGNFNVFFNEIVQEFRDEALLNQIEFRIKLDKTYQDIWFDRQVIEKVLLNLLNNSFKYTPKGGSIEIALLSSLTGYQSEYSGSIKMLNEYRAQEYIYLSIKDTGVGISENSIQHLFERYYRVSDHHMGSGIGLAFVKSLTFLHKGNIYVYSEQDKGTEVIIAIPCSKADYTDSELWLAHQTEGVVQLESMQFLGTATKSSAEVTTPADEEVKGEAGARKHSILIVDDNEDLRAFFKELLEPNYKVVEAENGEEGLIKAKNESPELIISDVMMPVMDGVAFCKSIRDNFETSHIPFILLTAKDALEFRLEGMESGADHYFSKPVSSDLLLLTIRNLFKQRQKLRERYQNDYQVEVRDLVNTEKDKKFLDRLLALIEEKIEDPELNVEYICQELATSRTQLYTKIKDITGQNIVEFVRKFRLKKAREIMTHEDVLIIEVMYRVGILSQSYFTSVFKKEFGMTPSQFQQQLNKKSAKNKKK